MQINARIMFMALASLVFMGGQAPAQWIKDVPNQVIYNDPLSYTVGIGLNNPNTDLKLDVLQDPLNPSGHASTIFGKGSVNGGGSSGYNLDGFAQGHIGQTTNWLNWGNLLGMTGKVQVNNIGNMSQTVTSRALAGRFTTTIDDPVVPGVKSYGDYYIGGCMGKINGELTIWPTNGAVAAVIGLDEVDGTNSWAGFFDGRGHFSSKVGIGSTSPGAYMLYVNGSAYATGTWTSSDMRWKRDIVTLDNALDKVLSLRGVSYEFRQDEFPEIRFPEGSQIGLIAQEAEAIVPEIVKTNDDGYKAIAYQNLNALLVEAMKEQNAHIESQQAEISVLRQELDAMRNAVEMLQQSLQGGGFDLGKQGRRPDVNETRGAFLLTNDPNPFSEETVIGFNIPEDVREAELVVSDATSGREMQRITIAERGTGSVTVSARNLSAGSYVYSLIADGRRADSGNMLVVR